MQVFKRCNEVNSCNATKAKLSVMRRKKITEDLEMAGDPNRDSEDKQQTKNSDLLQVLHSEVLFESP